jgi:eukaryotic-like serine/threonine-protein kinase
LRSDVDRRIQEMADLRLVENTVRACRDLRLQEALELVRKARQKLPQDERLLALEGGLNERIQKQSVEERRAEYLAKAREALQASRFADAVRLLEDCRERSICSDEVIDLLEFARAREAEWNLENVKKSNFDKAQALLHRGALEEAIRFIHAVLDGYEDVSLRSLLEQAESGVLELRDRIQAALDSALEMAREGRFNDAIGLLAVLPEKARHTPAVQRAIQLFADESKQELFRLTGRAYGLLYTDLCAGHLAFEPVRTRSAMDPSIHSLMVAFRARERECADRFLTDAAERVELLLEKQDKLAAEQLVRQAEEIAPMASPQGIAIWRKQFSQRSRRSFGTRLLD